MKTTNRILTGWIAVAVALAAAQVLADMAADIEASGADFFVIPCNTDYVFEDAILAATHIPLISIIGVSIAAAQDRAPDAERIGGR